MAAIRCRAVVAAVRCRAVVAAVRCRERSTGLIGRPFDEAPDQLMQRYLDADSYLGAGDLVALAVGLALCLHFAIARRGGRVIFKDRERTGFLIARAGVETIRAGLDLTLDFVGLADLKLKPATGQVFVKSLNAVDLAHRRSLVDGNVKAHPYVLCKRKRTSACAFSFPHPQPIVERIFVYASSFGPSL